MNESSRSRKQHGLYKQAEDRSEMTHKRELCFSLRKIQMEGLRRSPPVGTVGAVVVTVCFLGMMVQEVSATRWIVGSNMGWTNDVNYTVWAQDKQFYNGDWLFFVYDRNQKNVLEVNKTDYEACNSDHPLHNWTTGAGRDVVPLNVTREYYFISGKGFCYGGMKLAVQVENLPPPPSSLPLDQKNSAPPARTHNRSSIIIPVAVAVGVIWKAFVWLW